MLKIFNEQRGQTTFLEGPLGKQRLNLDFILSSSTKLTNNFKIHVVDEFKEYIYTYTNDVPDYIMRGTWCAVHHQRNITIHEMGE
jgi:hypothetical protein